jgi:hypothetical protein
MKLTTYPNGGLGSRSLADGSIHAGGHPSSFATNWLAVTSSLRANLVAVERGHGSGSVTVMDCRGAMRIDGEARGARQVLGEDEGARAALGRKRKGRG